MESTSIINTCTRLVNWSSSISPPIQTCGSFEWKVPTRRSVIVAHVQNSNFTWRRVTTSNSRGNVTAEAGARVPTSVPVRVAHELAQAGYRYLDVRTPDEFSMSMGHPSSAVNVPYMYRVGSGMVKNQSFLRQVTSHFRKHDEIIIGCESGQMSIMASTELLNVGFTGITDIAGGYVAWTENELPVEE